MKIMNSLKLRVNCELLAFCAGRGATSQAWNSIVFARKSTNEELGLSRGHRYGAFSPKIAEFHGFQEDRKNSINPIEIMISVEITILVKMMVFI